MLWNGVIALYSWQILTFSGIFRYRFEITAWRHLRHIFASKDSVGGTRKICAEYSIRMYLNPVLRLFYHGSLVLLGL